MRDWFSKNIGDAMLAGIEQNQIKQLISSFCEQADDSEYKAAFIRHESEGRLHCEVKIYLSPMLATVAKEINATPCEKPYSNDLSLLVGSQNSWLKLFPEHTNR